MNLETSINATDWLFILQGAALTVFLCMVSMAAGSAVGFAAGMMRTSGKILLRAIAWGYIYIIRGTPLLMQLFLVYFGIPLLTGRTIGAFATALVGLSIYTGAYMGEIVKAGISSVDAGQHEAAMALGMTWWQAFRHVVFPQAVRVIVPPAFGLFIALVKDSSLVSIIGFIELSRAGKLVIARTFQPFTIYFFVALVYFILCHGLSRLSRVRVFTGRTDWQ